MAGSQRVPGTQRAELRDLQRTAVPGTNRPTELYRINQDDSWDLIVGEPRLTPQGPKAPLSGMGIGFGSWFNGHFWRMAVHEGQLYVTTWDASVGLAPSDPLDILFSSQYGFDFFRTRDGVYRKRLPAADSQTA